jgi:hypothetical protein
MGTAENNQALFGGGADERNGQHGSPGARCHNWDRRTGSGKRIIGTLPFARQGARMLAALRFNLLSGRVIIEIESEIQQFLGRITAYYADHAVDPKLYAQAEARIVIAARERSVGIASPGETALVTHRDGDFWIQFFDRSRSAIPGPILLPRSGAGEPGFKSVEEGMVYHVQSILETALLRTLARTEPFLECFHAAAVVRRDCCLAVVGGSGSGKTTTAVSLCSLGWRLITDDVLLLNVETGGCVPVHRRLFCRRHFLSERDLIQFPIHDSDRSESSLAGTLVPFVTLGAADRPYGVTDFIFLEGIGDDFALSELTAVSGAIKLSKASFTASGTPLSRLALYLNGLGCARWWNCRLGDPTTTATALDARFSA